MKSTLIKTTFIKITLLVTLSLLVSLKPIGAETHNAVTLEVEVKLYSADSSRSIVVEQRSWEAPLGRRFNAFLANMSLEIQARRIDSSRVQLLTFLTTVGQRPDSRNRDFTIELGLPARIDNIRGKRGSFYRLTLRPMEFTNIDSSLCGYDHRDSANFKFDPTANFDLYYVPRSLGDFHWNKMKQLLEAEYRPFKQAFDITLSGKMHFYLHPCPTPTIGWDPRFGYAIDPTRAQAHAVYTHEYMAASPLVATLNQTMRVYGYAPPFLAEGIAAYLFYYEFETLRALKDSRLIHLRDLLTTQNYYSAEPLQAQAQAASFCRFLADKRGIDRLRRVYAESDDLNIESVILTYYGIGIDSLEIEWIEYLRALRPNKKQITKRANLEGASNNTEVAIAVMQSALEWDTTFTDTLMTLRNLAPLYSEAGQYDLALRTNQVLFENSAQQAGRNTRYLLRVAYLSYLTGDFPRARTAYIKLAELDSLRRESSDFGLARIMAEEGDTSGALVALDLMRKTSLSPIATCESALLKGFLLAIPGQYQDSVKADSAFSLAYRSATSLTNLAPTDPVNSFRLGLAALGLGKHDEARQNIEIALFMEFRPRHVARELIALGNLADILGNREEALTYYHRADSLDLSVPGQRESDRYLTQEFRIY